MELEGMLLVKAETCENCPLQEACSKPGEKTGKKGKPSGVSKSIARISGKRGETKGRVWWLPAGLASASRGLARRYGRALIAQLPRSRGLNRVRVSQVPGQHPHHQVSLPVTTKTQARRNRCRYQDPQSHKELQPQKTKCYKLSRRQQPGPGEE